MPNELYEKRREQMFPRLTKAQIARLEPQGHHLATTAGQILMEPGDREAQMFVVLSGSLYVEIPGGEEQMLYPLGPGDFAGEMSTLRGVPGFVRVQVREAGEVLVITDSDLRVVVQTDAELSELFMRAFILRRMGLIASPNSEATLIGSRYCGHFPRLPRPGPATICASNCLPCRLSCLGSRKSLSPRPSPAMWRPPRAIA